MKFSCPKKRAKLHFFSHPAKSIPKCTRQGNENSPFSAYPTAANANFTNFTAVACKHMRGCLINH